MINKNYNLEDLKKLMVSVYDPEKGGEVCNPIPLEVDSGLIPSMSLEDRIRRVIANDLSTKAQEAGEETFEEANDFDVDEEPQDFGPGYTDMTPEAPESQQAVVNENIDSGSDSGVSPQTSFTPEQLQSIVDAVKSSMAIKEGETQTS